MKNLLIALSLAVLGATLVASSAQAQRRGGGGFARGRGAGAGGARPGRARGFYRGSGYAPYAYAPYFFSNSGYDPDLGFDSLGYDSNDEPLLEAPSYLIVNREPYRPAAPPAPAKPSEGPVLLELQGDHWVRITHNGPPQIDGQSYQPEPEQAANPPAAAPSAVLVFRDGHKEEIGKYCIMGATIHITTDYWSTGSWNRTVAISDLDVPATLKLNQERGSHFRLPSGPYEVMIGG